MGPSSPHTMLVTVAAAMSIGVLLIVLCRRFNVSAVVVLLLAGVGLGPEGLGLVDARGLGAGLPVIVSLAIGLILFEGGLTLNLEGFRSASAMIRRLLTVGTLITWFATAAAIWLLFGFDPFFCLLSASLVIVTGPTVIAPLIKRTKLTPRLHSILHWEGVLIDPVGVFVAILCYEWVGEYGRDAALVRFLLRFVWGVGLGVAGGLVVNRLIRSRLVADDMINVFALASAVLLFGISEALFTESGLLTVTVAGFVLGVKRPGELREIRQFKAEITDLLIGTLFILLSARLELSQFGAYGYPLLLLVLAVMVVVRPLNVLVSSWRLDFTWREKCFLGWVAPRGIVAASMASLFAINLRDNPTVPDAAFVETFVYSVIVATVLLQSLTAAPFARLLGLVRPAPEGWLIVGAHALGRQLARFLKEAAGRQVVLIDTNPAAVAEARDEGLTVLQEDARDPELDEADELQGVGHLLALTDNEDLNVLLCQHWGTVFDRDRLYYWSANPEAAEGMAGRPAWPGLPKPSLISGELMRDEAVLLRSERTPEASNDLSRPLMAVRNGRVLLRGLDAGPGGRDTTTVCLSLTREADYLRASLRPEWVVRLEETDIADILGQLVGRVAHDHPELPEDEITGRLVGGNGALPTSLGHGVAVAHAYSDRLAARMAALAHIPQGLGYASVDGEPIRFVFLLLSPPGDPEGHLETLADIARMMGNAATRSRMRAAKDPDELLDAIRGSGH